MKTECIFMSNGDLRIPVDSSLIAFCRDSEIVIKQDDEEKSEEIRNTKIDENYVPEYVKAIVATLGENSDIKILKLNLC